MKIELSKIFYIFIYEIYIYILLRLYYFVLDIKLLINNVDFFVKKSIDTKNLKRSKIIVEDFPAI